MKAEDVILAMKTSQDGWHSECVMTDRMKVLAEAVRELAWALRETSAWVAARDFSDRAVSGFKLAKAINGL